MNLKFLPDADALLDVAFRRARKQATAMRVPRDRFKATKSKEITKVEVAANYLNKNLDACVKAVPKLDELQPFYRELVGAIIDVAKLKRCLAQMNSVNKIINKLKKQAIGKIKAERTDAQRIFNLRNEFYGRVSSLVKDLNASIEYYNDAGKKLRELPSIDFSLPTTIIAGYPNTGKTTILLRLTGSKPKIASYPFTTQGIQVGYFDHGYIRIQVIDTPGLLDRPLEKRNKIERKAIAALRHLANAIVFIIDPTHSSGFSLEEQLHLLKEIKSAFRVPLIKVLNKVDIASKEEIAKARQKIGGKVVHEGKGIESNLSKEIVEALKAGK